MTHEIPKARPEGAAVSRRGLLGGAAVSALVAAQARTAQAFAGDIQTDESFVFEIRRSDAEWRAQLSEHDHAILREGGTEEKFSSPHWDSRAEGRYCCKGCDLTLYDSAWQAYPDVGWVFFRQSRPNSILMGIDSSDPYGMTNVGRLLAVIEAHCRRCGSHLGHLLTINGTTLHCINGSAMTFSDHAA